MPKNNASKYARAHAPSPLGTNNLEAGSCGRTLNTMSDELSLLLANAWIVCGPEWSDVHDPATFGLAAPQSYSYFRRCQFAGYPRAAPLPPPFSQAADNPVGIDDSYTNRLASAVVSTSLEALSSIPGLDTLFLFLQSPPPGIFGST